MEHLKINAIISAISEGAERGGGGLLPFIAYCLPLPRGRNEICYEYT